MFQTKTVDCFVASETWFRDVHDDSLVAIPGFSCFRDDRIDRIGGGVAVWSKFHLSPEKITITKKPAGIEVVAIRLNCKLLIIGCYVPPQVVAKSHDEVIRYFIDIIDTFLDQNSSFDVVL